MIITKAPLRLSLLGGGSDLPSYYLKGNPGKVISTAINKFVYIFANEVPNQFTRLIYSKIENVKKISQLKHNIAREILSSYNPEIPLEIASFADIPTIGTGMGSSSVFAVALISAMNALYGIPATKEEVAEEACHIEIDVCGSPIGKQDQYAATFGGFNTYEFSEDRVIIKAVDISSQNYDLLQNRLLLFYTGKRRNANDILSIQNKTDNTRILDIMVSLVDTGLVCLKEGYLDHFGDLLDEAWRYKRQLAPGITDPEIDEIYLLGKYNGASGGKILGAGGGGFMCFYCIEENQEQLIQAMSKNKLAHFEFAMYDKGVEVLVNSPSNPF